MARKAVKRVALLVLVLLTSYVALLLYNSSSTCTTVGMFLLTLCVSRMETDIKYGSNLGPNTFNEVETNTVMIKRIDRKYLHCTDSLCSEYLSSSERRFFNYCHPESGKLLNIQEASCHFMDGTGRRPVALASFPGSGNTWVRGLLEKATGICTGEEVHQCMKM